MKRILCLALLLCLLSGCVGDPGIPWADTYDQGKPPSATIAYVPLDNRPVNTTRVTLLAQSAGFRLLMPEESLYRTALDGQALNPNGTRYGDGDALLKWLEQTEADYYVISVDQILSGGLVNSRWMTEISDEPQRIDQLLSILAGKSVILFDTVMRLAPTVGYGGYTLEEYEALRQYAKLPRPFLSGEESAEAVIAGYALPTELGEAVVSPYLEARSRKLQLSAQLISAVSRHNNIFLYYGIDDSSPENTIQTNEIAFLKQNLTNGLIFAGTDEMGMLAVARTIGQHYGHSELPMLGIRYFGADPDSPADAYDIGSLKSSIGAHLEALGIRSASEGCDLELLVFGGEDPAGILQHYRDNQQKGIPSMIVDLREDPSLPLAILSEESLDPAWLLSYSSWNTAGNAIGIALSSGIARYLYLKNESIPVQGANAAFLKSLSLSFAKDVSYVQAKPHLDPQDPQQALRAVIQDDPLGFQNFASWLEGKSFLSSLAPVQTGRIPAISVTELSFPWCRTFEAELEIRLG